MPKFYRAFMATLLAVLVLFAVEVQADPLAPDHVPRGDLVCLFLAPSHELDGIDDGQHAVREHEWQRPKLASNVTGGTITSAVPHDPG